MKHPDMEEGRGIRSTRLPWTTGWSVRHCFWSLVAVNVYCRLVSPWACFSLVMLPGCLYLILALISTSDSSGSLLWLLSGLWHKQSSLYCGVLPALLYVICLENPPFLRFPSERQCRPIAVWASGLMVFFRSSKSA